MDNQSEFYVGYLPIPAGLKKWMRRTVAGLAAAAVGVAIVLVTGQHPFPPSTFDFGKVTDIDGVLLTKPYPALVAQDGQLWLLVAAGKHGFTAPADFDGRIVHLRGERIYRGADRMVEVQSGSWSASGKGELPNEIDLGHTQLTGELVDSKCYFGVMNPGQGKVHRDCAARCLSGGIPPALVVRDADGTAMTVVVANWRREMLEHVGEPVTLRGRLVRSAGRLILYAE